MNLNTRGYSTCVLWTLVVVAMVSGSVVYEASGDPLLLAWAFAFAFPASVMTVWLAISHAALKRHTTVEQIVELVHDLDARRDQELPRVRSLR